VRCNAITLASLYGFEPLVFARMQPLDMIRFETQHPRSASAFHAKLPAQHIGIQR
jgi:hypothetical protein